MTIDRIAKMMNATTAVQNRNFHSENQLLLLFGSFDSRSSSSALPANGSCAALTSMGTSSNEYSNPGIALTILAYCPSWYHPETIFHL